MNAGTSKSALRVVELNEGQQSPDIAGPFKRGQAKLNGGSIDA